MPPQEQVADERTRLPMRPPRCSVDRRPQVPVQLLLRSIQLFNQVLKAAFLLLSTKT
jgi:hypothetical protein